MELLFEIYTPDDRRSAYLKLSKDLHPDHNAGKSAEENDVIHNQVPDVHYFVSSFNFNRYTRIGQNLQYMLYNNKNTNKNTQRYISCILIIPIPPPRQNFISQKMHF